MDTDIIARGMAGAAKEGGVVTKEKVTEALGYTPTYVDDESNGSSESTYSSEKIIKKISEVESWTGTKAEWEALDKSTLVNGQQINITDDEDTVLTNADVEKFTNDLNVAVEKAETAATDCENVKSELTDYSSPLFIKPTIKGQSIVVEDSVAAPIYELDIYGKSTQIQYNGYQLLKPSYFPETASHDGVTWTNNGDGSFTAEGKPTVSAVNIHSEKIHLASGTYIANSLGVTGLKNVVSAYKPDASVVYYSGNKSFTIDDTIDYIVFNIQATDAFSGTETKVYPMLESGSTEHSYEPYVGGVPSPNPDYPQSISDIKDVTITVARRNLLARLNPAGGASVTANEDGSFTIKGVSTKSFPQFILPAAYGEYTLSIEQDNATGHEVYLQNTVEDYTNPITSVTGKVTKTCSGYLRVLMSVQSTANFTIKLMLEKGSVVHPFQKYEAQTAVAAGTFRGFPVSSGGNYTDSTGQQWVCDTLTVKNDGSGVLTQMVEKIQADPEAITLTHYNNLNLLREDLAKPGVAQYATPILCNRALRRAWTTTSSLPVCFINENRSFIFGSEALSELWSSLDDIKSWLQANPVEFIYVLGTPVTTELTPSQVEKFLALNTYYPVTTVYNDKGAEMGITYIADTKNYIDNKFSELSAAIVSSASEEE